MTTYTKEIENATTYTNVKYLHENNCEQFYSADTSDGTTVGLKLDIARQSDSFALMVFRKTSWCIVATIHVAALQPAC